MSLDKIILKQSDGFNNPSNPLWGQYQTFVLDIDNRGHLLWLNKQYKLGAVMVAHSYTNYIPEHKNTITLLPTKMEGEYPHITLTKLEKGVSQ